MTEDTKKQPSTFWLKAVIGALLVAIGFVGGFFVPRKAYVHLDKIGMIDEIYEVYSGETLRLQEHYNWGNAMMYLTDSIPIWYVPVEISKDD